MRLILLGPPGAGKGTQAGVLSKNLRIPHISTGDMLRDAVNKKSELGMKAHSFMIKGELVPDELVIQIVTERITELDTQKGFILDGFPRTTRQAEELTAALDKLSIAIDLVLYFDTSTDVSIERLCGRRVCPECGKNYHIVNIPPKVNEICDTCNVKIIQRQDDKEDTVKNRLKVYEQQTKGLVGYYKEKSILRKVPGDFNVNQLYDYLMKLFADEKFS